MTDPRVTALSLTLFAGLLGFVALDWTINVFGKVPTWLKNLRETDTIEYIDDDEDGEEFYT